jgi:hypothetical protein
MVDTDVLLASVLRIVDVNNPLNPLLNAREGTGSIFTADLPEDFKPEQLGPGIVVASRGGLSNPDLEVVTTRRVQITVWDEENRHVRAAQVMSAIFLWLRSLNNVTVAGVGTMLACYEVVPPQVVVDPDTDWTSVVAFYEITARAEVDFQIPYNPVTGAPQGLVYDSRKVNGKPLSADVVLTTADVADSLNKRYVTDGMLADLADITVAGTGFLIGFYVTPPSSVVAGVFITGGDVRMFLFYNPFTITIRNISLELTTPGAAGKKYDVGLYSLDKQTKLVSTGSQPADAAAGVKTHVVGPATIRRGFYWHAQTSDDAATQMRLGIGSNAAYSAINGAFVKTGNAGGGGAVLPAAIGGITGSFSRSPILTIYEP